APPLPPGRCASIPYLVPNPLPRQGDGGLSEGNVLICELWSGGQTGVDRAALDVARVLGIPHHGWVPAGRRAEDGVIGPEYDGLRETESPEYAERTELNV